MKQGKQKKSAAESTASAAAATPELPDAAYVDQLLGGEANSSSDAAAGTASGVIELPAQCLLRDAVEYRQRFLDCVEADSVTVDVGAVDRIDTAFIQVLLAFARTRAAAKRAITWQRVSPEFAASVSLLGVQAVLAVPDVSNAA
jgi:phospholipid transport system transporter-binding protein